MARHCGHLFSLLLGHIMTLAYLTGGKLAPLTRARYYANVQED